MTALKNLTGLRFGRLLVVARGSNSSTSKAQWICDCTCGKQVVVVGVSLRKGLTSSCGCYRKETATRRAFRHGGKGTVEYSIWQGIHYRCRSGHPDYGGRGIQVCRRWQKFENFLRDMGPRPTDRHSIDRIDNDDNYEPKNCRWATAVEQTRNARSNHLVTYMGDTRTVAEWAERSGLLRATIAYRIRRGWPPEKALTKRTNDKRTQEHSI